MKTLRMMSRASGPLAFFRNTDTARSAGFRILLPLLCCIAWGCGGEEEAVVTSSGGSPNPSAVNVSNVGSFAPGIAVANVAPAVALAATQKAKVVKGYGSISGQILFDGEVPKPELAIAKGDPNVTNSAICAAQDAYDNELLVDEKTKGVANVFVYIYYRNAKGMKIHPDAAKLNNLGKKAVVFDQKNCRFIPHVMVVLAGQTVVIKSGDNIPHNTHTTTIFNDEFNSIIAANDRVGVKLKLTSSESLPMPVKCDIHPWMKAHWLIIDHPYATLTDKQGRFTIKNLPVGEIEFRIWHERPGYIDRKYVVNVEEGTTQLDPVSVPAAKFAKQ